MQSVAMQQAMGFWRTNVADVAYNDGMIKKGYKNVNINEKRG